ncbi:MAG: hypothetical protein HY360_05850 [Verrucomicrobia bacterium]|nr:hypothetical protein [Verrucomicrobiota bacterium]
MKHLIFADLSCCRPNSVLAKEERQGCWRLLSYRTCEEEPSAGVMIGAASHLDAPEVSLPLGVSGWHAIYVGFWNPPYVYDGGTTVKIRLSGDPCFIRISEGEPAVDYHATCIKEAFFKAADLTGQDIVFGKVSGVFAQKAYIAYVRLAPLSEDEIAAIQTADRAPNTRTVHAAIDGASYLWDNQYATSEHLLELIERHRHSDVGKVIWAVNYGLATNYPSRAGAFWPDNERRVPIEHVPGNNKHLAGEITARESLRRLVAAGVIPQVVAARHVHEMGAKFDVMFRLAILGCLPPQRSDQVAGFVETHPEFRQVTKEGVAVEKASYAFPEVRAAMLAIIRETVEMFDIDGANLCFVRGPHFMQHEKPVLDDFRRQYGEDARNVAFLDPRMKQLRCGYLNTLVRDTRCVLDDIGARKGRRLELSVWVYSSTGTNLLCGFDVESWTKEDWVDSVILHPAEGSSYRVDPQLAAIVKTHGRALIYALGCMGSYPPSGSNWAREAEIVNAETVAAIGAPVDGFALWDLDTVQDFPESWEMIRRLGHADERPLLARRPPVLKTARISEINGHDLLQGLGTILSGG